MSEPNLPIEMGPQKRAPQIDGREAYNAGKGEIDQGGFSRSHKGRNRGGHNQPSGTHVQTAAARYEQEQ